MAGCVGEQRTYVIEGDGLLAVVMVGLAWTDTGGRPTPRHLVRADDDGMLPAALSSMWTVGRRSTCGATTGQSCLSSWLLTCTPTSRRGHCPTDPRDDDDDDVSAADTRAMTAGTGRSSCWYTACFLTLTTHHPTPGAVSLAGKEAS